MAMSDEEINALNESIRELNDSMKMMADTFASVANQSKTVSDNLNKTSTGAKNADTNINTMAKATIRSKGALDQFSESTAEATKRQQAYKDAQASGIQATLGFADALVSAERGFTKFSGALNAAGDAAMELGKSHGPVGEVLGRIVKAGTMLGEKYLEQADSLLKARDELYRMGSAGAFNTEELLRMAHASGLTSNNLELLIKPIKSMGPAVLSLGANAGDSAQAFARLTAVTVEQRSAMNRLGVSQEELYQGQSDFVKLQQMSGVQLNSRYKTEAQLQKASLDYIVNLRELSAITGEDVDTLKQRQQEVASQAEFQIRNLQLQEKENQLREEGIRTGNAALIAEADKIQAQIDAEESTRDLFASFGDPKLTKAITELMTTGGSAISEDSGAFLSLIGDEGQQLLAQMREGDETAGAKLAEVFKNSQLEAAKGSQGTAAIYDEGYRNFLFMSDQLLARNIANADANIPEQLDNAAARSAEAMSTSFDTAATARAALTEVEIAAAVKLDQMVAATNPLIGELDALKIAFGSVSVLAAAAGVAIAAMTAAAGANAMLGRGRTARGTQSRARDARGRFTRTPEPETGLWNRARSAAPRATGLVRGVAGIGAAYGVIEAGVSGLQTNRDITNRQEAGEISAVEARRERGANYGGTAGTAAGTAGGAWAGAASGAALGTLLLPGIGTAIGGFIGAGLGAWAGGAAGEALGSTLGETIAASTSDNLEEEVQNLEMPGETSTPGTAATATARSTPSVEIPWDAMRELASQTFDEKESENIATNIDLLKMFGEAMSSIPEIKPIVIDEGWFSDEIKMPWDIIKDFGEASLPEPDKIIKNVEVVQAFSNAAPTLAAISELKPVETGGMLSSLKMPWEVIQDFGNTELPTVKQIEDNQSIINAFANAVVDMSNISDIKRIETGIFGGALSSLDMPWEVINDFGNTSLPAVEQITNNQSIINAFANAVVDMSNIPEIKRIETGIFGGALSGLKMPWEVIQDFGDTELPTVEQVSNNTNVVKAFTDAVPTLVAMSELKRVNIADGLRNNLVMPWHVIKDFGEVELPPAENVAKNTAVVKAFTDAVPTLASMSELERINIGNGLFNNFAMPWDVISDFGNTSLPTAEQITNNQSIINAFANAVVDMSNIPEIKRIETGIFGGMLSSLDMPWDVISDFGNTELPTIEQISNNKLVIDAFANAVVDMSNIPEIKRVETGIFGGLFSGLDMPWNIIRDFGNTELPTVKQIEDNQSIINAFTDAATDMTTIPEIKFSEESEDSLDRLTNKLKDFSKLNSSDILDNIAALSELSKLTNENQRIEQLQTPTTITIPSTPEQITAAITSRTLNTAAANTVSTTAATATTAANNTVSTEMSDIMSLLSYKLDNVISLLETGVTIQDRILLESRS